MATVRSIYGISVSDGKDDVKTYEKALSDIKGMDDSIEVFFIKDSEEENVFVGIVVEVRTIAYVGTFPMLSKKNYAKYDKVLEPIMKKYPEARTEVIYHVVASDCE